MIEQIAQIMNMTGEEVLNHPTFLVNAFDAEHRILFWNKKCERYFSISADEALGQVLEDLIPHCRNNPKMKLLAKALSGKTVFVPHEKYDKTNTHYTQIVLPLKNNAGDVIAAVNIVSDVPVPLSERVKKLRLLTVDR